MNQQVSKPQRFEIEYTRVAGTHEIYDTYNAPGGYATPLTRHTLCEMLNEYYAQNIALRAALESMCDTFGRMFDNNPPPDEFESDAQARHRRKRAVGARTSERKIEMKSGLLWYDSTKKTLLEKIEDAAARYQHKFGVRPNCAFVNPTDMPIAIESETSFRTKDIVVESKHTIMPQYVWVGVDEARQPVADAASKVIYAQSEI